MKRWIFGWLASLLLTASLTGCGSDSSTQTSGVVVTTPAKDAVGVAVNSSAQAMVIGELDPDSVASATASFEGPATIPGTVSYDAATGLLTITPASNLDNGAVYRLTISGLKDGTGRALPPAVTKFTTVRNPVTHDWFFYSGHPMLVTATTFDGLGRKTREFQTFSAGLDQVWFTNDDTYSSNFTYTYDAAGNTTRVYYSGAGGDGQWGTADDIIDSYKKISYDTAGNVIREVYYYSPGPDGQWLTADDPVQNYTAYTYDSRGRRDKWINFRGPGPDGVWFTADDTVYQYGTDIYAADGSFMFYRCYIGPGNDGTWFTADDTLTPTPASGTGFIRDGQGRLVRTVYYSDPGPDGNWGTGDDSIAAYQSHSYDARGNMVRTVTYNGPGPDGLWFTADDQIYYYENVTFDAKGNKVDQSSYFGPGSDGVWFTADDELSSKKDFITTL